MREGAAAFTGSAAAGGAATGSGTGGGTAGSSSAAIGGGGVAGASGAAAGGGRNCGSAPFPDKAGEALKKGIGAVGIPLARLEQEQPAHFEHLRLDVLVRVGGHSHHRGLRVRPAQLLQQLEAAEEALVVQSRHHDVDRDRERPPVAGLPVDRGETGRAGLAGNDAETAPPQGVAGHPAEERVVVDEDQRPAPGGSLLLEPREGCFGARIVRYLGGRRCGHALPGPLVDHPGALEHQPLGVDAAVEDERLRVDAVLAAPLDLGQLEAERPLAPGEEEHDGVLDLLRDHLLEHGLLDQFQLHEDAAEQLATLAGALDLEGLFQVVGAQQPAGDEQLAEGLALARGDGLDDLALADDDLALLTLALEHQDA